MDHTVKRAFLASLVFVVVLVLPLPAFAAASQPGHSAELSLRADGYRVRVIGLATAKAKASSQVFVSVAKSLGEGKVGFTQASYLVRGRVTGRAIRADLGSFGFIGVRFHPRGRIHKQHIPGCAGTLFTSQSGHFIGRIRFRGESGYVGVDAKRALGRVGTQGAYKCPGSGSGPPPIPKGKRVEQVTLSATTKDRELSFSATERPNEPPSPFAIDGPVVEYAATEIEPCGAVSITRTIFVEGSAESFVFDHALKAATVTPPEPFAGSVGFTRDPSTGATSWTGNLSAPFLGLDQTLVVPALKAQLKRNRVDPNLSVLHAYVDRCPSGA